LDIKEDWKRIQSVLAQGQASSIYCSIATVDPDGMPNITPVGTVFLRDDQTGYFFDHYAVSLGHNIDENPNICIMAVNSGAIFWAKALLFGRFSSPPGVRLYGKAGCKREATASEIALIEKRVKAAQLLKGGRLLWSGFSQVRDISFSHYRPVKYPVMMDSLW
jgi:uncharacterized protein